MNLHGIVSSAIATVNPFVPVELLHSTGYATSPSGKRTPAYAEPVTINVQVQALTYSDLRQLDSLNIQGVRRAVYLDGYALAVVRNLKAGGDLMIFQPGVFVEGTHWLVAHVLEQWPDWYKVAITLQETPAS